MIGPCGLHMHGEFIPESVSREIIEAVDAKGEICMVEEKRRLKW